MALITLASVAGAILLANKVTGYAGTKTELKATRTIPTVQLAKKLWTIQYFQLGDDGARFTVLRSSGCKNRLIPGRSNLFRALPSPCWYTVKL